MTQWRRPYKLRRDATHAKRPFFHQPGKWVSAENFPVCIPHSRRVSPDVTLRGRRAAPGVEMKFQRCLEGKKNGREEDRHSEEEEAVVNQRCGCFLSRKISTGGKNRLTARRGPAIQPSLRSVPLPAVDLLGKLLRVQKLPRKSCTS